MNGSPESDADFPNGTTLPSLPVPAKKRILRAVEKVNRARLEELAMLNLSKGEAAAVLGISDVAMARLMSIGENRRAWTRGRATAKIAVNKVLMERMKNSGPVALALSKQLRVDEDDADLATVPTAAPQPASAKERLVRKLDDLAERMARDEADDSNRS